MSGGQQQRVGIARALVVKPKIIFADEPTGNLDSKTTMEVLALMRRIVREQNQTLVMVTHDNHLATYADRQFHIVDGKILKIEEQRRRDEEDIAGERESEGQTSCNAGNMSEEGQVAGINDGVHSEKVENTDKGNAARIGKNGG